MCASRLFLTVIMLWALVQVSSAHGRLSVPKTRDMLAQTPTYKQNEPVPLMSSKHVCRDFNASTVQASWQAGGTYKTEWVLEAAHPGDCFFYLSYDKEATWMKIAQIRDCHLIRSYDLTIPTWVPNGNNVVLRWEWYALQQVVNVEHYVQCSDISISGGATGSVVWTPVVIIPGHLPQDASKYRLVYEPNAPFFFTGPEIARPTSQPPSSPPQITGLSITRASDQKHTYTLTLTNTKFDWVYFYSPAGNVGLATGFKHKSQFSCTTNACYISAPAESFGSTGVYSLAILYSSEHGYSNWSNWFLYPVTA